MCAGSRECVRLPVHIFPDGKFLLSALDHAALTNWDSFDIRDARLSVAALVEALWRPTRWIKDRRPRIGLAANLVGNRHAGGGTIADTPPIEAGCYIKAACLL
jgi:hypothetical protein